MMQRTIALLAQEVSYTLKMSARARSLRLTIHPDGRIVVTAPAFLEQGSIEQFIRQKADWVLGKLARFKNAPPRTVIEAGRGGFKKYKDLALALVRERVEHFNVLYQVRYNRITIRNQRARWGSCSQKRNLSFNFKIALLPAALRDYIIVHELCHLKEMNHSRAFWAQVERALPDWRALRQQLKKIMVR